MFAIIALASFALTESKKGIKHKKGSLFENGNTKEWKTDDLVSVRSRRPRQSSDHEKKELFPCITCFPIGSRELCTTPSCPDGYQCDKPSRRCHRRASTAATRQRQADAAAAAAAEEEAGN